ncbi:hypothetical protein M501DRAFT_1059808 [Patellaria atrata CBS 101060]|uniref:L-type lectin-like domain-containing protein n=1 Tax=Patellaria atrata CBS 101060 TaxID=1346257 RepID=A0A9P4VPM2_9PEZI|nr:hypothetical protein M501DRAFT_1059808 [Patellaria atrata CBS 101060]
MVTRLWNYIWLLLWSLGLISAQDGEIKSIALRTHSLGAPYLDSDLQSRWFDFGGDTVVRTDKYIRLTSDRPSRAGWLFSRVPLTATNWEIEVEFKIHGQNTLYGDGFAMWLTKQRATGGDVFGFVDKWDGLAIFFDTYKNNRPGVVFPLVLAAMNDGTQPYDKENDGKANELAGCSSRGIRNQNFPTKARLTYFAEKSLKLELHYKTEGKWTECFDIPDVKIPPVAYLGFSAETGELSDNHDIISIQTRNLYQPNKPETGTGGSTLGGTGSKGGFMGGSTKGKVRTEGGGWGWFLVKFVLFGFAVVGAYVGFTAWRTSRRASRF